MRYLLFFLLFISSCQRIETSKLELSELSKIQNIELPSQLELLELSKIQNIELPPSQLEYQEQIIYPIRTRVVIEYYSGQINDKPISLFAISPELIKKELQNAESVFSDVALQFDIAEITFHKFSSLDTYINDSVVHSQYLSIYYLLPKPTTLQGFGSAPWLTEVNGVFMFYVHDEWGLSHEIGHFFGLLHTFDEDHCDDTIDFGIKCTDIIEILNTTSQPTSQPDLTNFAPNCRNIMNYCEHLPKCLTPNQVTRIRAFIRSSRHKVVSTKDSKQIDIPVLYNILHNTVTK